MRICICVCEVFTSNGKYAGANLLRIYMSSNTRQISFSAQWIRPRDFSDSYLASEVTINYSKKLYYTILLFFNVTGIREFVYMHERIECLHVLCGYTYGWGIHGRLRYIYTTLIALHDSCFAFGNFRPELITRSEHQEWNTISLYILYLEWVYTGVLR